jgi:Family of unknown function (DUF5670)
MGNDRNTCAYGGTIFAQALSRPWEIQGRYIRRTLTMGSLVNILWTVAVVLVVIWLLGLIFNLAAGALGWLLHLLLVVAVIIIIYNLVTGRRAV